MRGAAFFVVAGLLAAGCTQPPAGPQGTVSGWEEVVEASMAPDFSEHGDTFPVLLVHQHYVTSPAERERDRNVVCVDVAGQEIPLYDPMPRSYARCMGPPADAATGRVFMDGAEFDARRAEALVVRDTGCNGSLVFLDATNRTFAVRTVRHDFQVALLDNGTFTVDGRWIEPGTTLKIGYYVDHGDPRHERYVRVAFDNPGRWLRAAVAPYHPEKEEDIPAPVEQGTGLEAWVPREAAGPADVVQRLVEATPHEVYGIEAMRVVHGPEGLTEVRVALATWEGTVSWFGAGSTHEAIHLLGAWNESARSAVLAPEDLASFPTTWDILAAGHEGLIDVRVAGRTSFTSPDHWLATVPMEAAGCPDGCVFVDVEEPAAAAGWRRTLTAEPQDHVGRTLQVVVHDAGESTQVWWHRPW